MHPWSTSMTNIEQASDEDLSHFVVETDSDGHHYAVRREDMDKLG